MLAGSQLAPLTISRWAPQRLLQRAMGFLVAAPVILLTLQSAGWGLWAVLPPLWILALGQALVSHEEPETRVVPCRKVGAYLVDAIAQRFLAARPRP